VVNDWNVLSEEIIQLAGFKKGLGTCEFDPDIAVFDLV